MKDIDSIIAHDRGQAHVLEGVAAALLVLTSVVFAIQVTAVTPLTASTANQHLQTQGAGSAAGLLAAADERGTLRTTVLYWNESSGRFHDSGESAQYEDVLPTEFGSTLETTLSRQGMVYNVNLIYLNRENEIRERPLLYQGDPSDHAVRAVRTVTLYETDTFTGSNGDKTDLTVLNSTNYFIHNVKPGPVYNVVRVEVVVWRV